MKPSDDLGPMVVVDAPCKFCKTVLHLQISEAYHKTGDSLRLVSLAACDRCADLRTRRSKLHRAFERVCANLIIDPKDSEVRKAAYEAFTGLTKGYIRLICEWFNVTIPWEEQMVDGLMHRPQMLGAVLKSFWALARQNQLGI